MRLHVDGGGQLHSEEAAAARRVGKDVGHVGCCDERCTSRQGFYRACVWQLHLHFRQLHDVFQEALLYAWRYGVELVEVDEQRLRHGHERGFLLRQVKTVGESLSELWRQYTAAECRLVVALS